MKQTIWGQPRDKFCQCLKRRIFLCIFVTILILTGNFTALIFRTEENHILLLICNILSDIVWGFFLIYFTEVHIIPTYRLKRLMERDATDLSGTVRHISSDILRYMDIDCYCIHTDDRRLFLPAGTFSLQEGQTYRFRIAANIILEAEQ